MSVAAATAAAAARPPPSTPALRRLVAFYDGSGGQDSRGRTLEEILGWDDNHLELSHDYIQTLFPLPEGSLFANAPIIDEDAYLYWRQHDGLRRNLRRAFDRIMAFYGFQVQREQQPQGEGDAPPKLAVVARDDAARTSFPRWVRLIDHNHLRISRILRSLRILGLEEEAEGFYEALSWTYETYGRIGANSRKFWRRAMRLPLHIAPDGEEVDWLEKYDVQETSDDEE